MGEDNLKRKNSEKRRISLLIIIFFFVFLQCLFSVKTKTFADLVESRKKNDNETPCAFKFSLLLRLFPEMIKTINESKKTKQTVLETKQNISVLSLFVALSDFFLTKTLK